ncbi:XamI family restriction endonuclease [Micromonospora sp. FIMYZ51]|uniref:XamI family restriction endonuclease n=1 Tax=Micromonospora sp. FIMYZ51 TaxID=3051832 RepID=UPI00311E3949
MPLAFYQPPSWTEEALKAARDHAESLFTAHRREEGPRSFARMYDSLRPQVEQLFAASKDLLDLTGEVFIADPSAWQAGRYVCGPPISQEDLWTLVGSSKFRKVPPGLAEATADAIRVVIDPVRFPWVEQRRYPRDDEREAAILATSVLWAAQQLATERRGEASTRQEALTGETLSRAGLVLDPSRSPIHFFDDMQRGTYSRERHIAGAKCDVPIRLPDGRLLALECKVSNGPKNGWKRVNREVVGKAEAWRSHFGVQLITGVVLAGVFDMSCLRTAQQAGVILFWEHDLTPLHEFVSGTNG